MAFEPGRRSNAAELMDGDAVDILTLRGCLTDLARVNRLSLGYRPTLAFLETLRRSGRLPSDRALQIVDVGSGYGDMLREVAAWARRRGVSVALTGVDRAPAATRIAGAATPADMPIAWRTADIFAYRHDAPVDVVLSALFTHHLDDWELVRFIGWMEATAALGWFVNDLHRHRLPYLAFAQASRALRLHRFVQHDGPVSFARSFVPADWRRSLAAAGVPSGAAAIGWWMPFRLCVSRMRLP